MAFDKYQSLERSNRMHIAAQRRELPPMVSIKVLIPNVLNERLHAACVEQRSLAGIDFGKTFINVIQLGLERLGHVN